MSLITLDQARAQLRVEDDYPEDQIQPYIDAAEANVQQFLNRRVYASATELNAAIADIPDMIANAKLAYEAALVTNEGIEDDVTRAYFDAAAAKKYSDAIRNAREIYDGMVITSDIEAAILLFIGHLNSNREAVTDKETYEMPLGVEHLLMPYRTGW